MPGGSACVSKNPMDYTVAMPFQGDNGTNPSLDQLMTVLQTSDYPSQRECAVEALIPVGASVDPAVLAIVAKRAHEDAAGSVRAACVRCLARSGANDKALASFLNSMHADADPRVCQEVAAAETHQASGATRPPLQSAGFSEPR
jgi:hypothetical protein